MKTIRKNSSNRLLYRLFCVTLQKEFNTISNVLDDGEIEYWFARDLQKTLGYDRWENFTNVIKKAKVACETLAIDTFDHFRDVTKMVTIGQNVPKQIDDIIYIRDNVGLGDLADGLEDIARIRIDYPEASLKELGAMLLPSIGKSGVNHRLRKLSQIAEQLRENKEEK